MGKVQGTLKQAALLSRAGLLGLLSIVGAGCVHVNEEDLSPSSVELTWGRSGVSDGRFQKPRAAAIDGQDRIYVVDMTARIQVFDREGNFLRAWSTPTHKNGRPSGLSVGRDGTVLVADTHYFRMLPYTPEGELLADRVIGGTNGFENGEFGFVTDIVQDSAGNYYIAEYGEHDRIQKFSPEGEFLEVWGGHGPEPGQFMRPQNLAIDQRDRIWVADACNHRIQVFSTEGELLTCWGKPGSAPGQLYYPYDLVLDGQGHVYVCEFGNHRVQKFTEDGQPLGTWGKQGRGVGQLFNPWALVRDSQGSLHVIDSNNHRVQRVLM